MTLPELVALAVEKVPRFERPLKYCDECDDPMEFPGKTRDEYGQTRTCGWCDGTGALFNNSPAALLMAVVLHRCKTQEPLLGRGHGIFCLPVDSAPDTRETPESIARAALVALLRAHGVGMESQ